MSKDYLVAVKVEGVKKNEIFSFSSKEKRDGFIVELKKRNFEYCTTEVEDWRK